jgi:alkanesulfonate monooxygenase SsuD/methylene tetrahydromethanopterin reductase-like flavin-dependent oxidoreductase (luciferase family)
MRVQTPAGVLPLWRSRSSWPLKVSLINAIHLDTYGDVTHDDDGQPLTHVQTIRNIVEQGVLADQVGVDFFGIGEHHTDDFPLSAADVVLDAIAARTSRIRLGSAVTVLSSDDPVRVFQRYSTLDAVSGGRAEVILGRGPASIPSRSSATPLPTTKTSSRRRPTSSPNYSRADRSPGRARPARR